VIVLYRGTWCAYCNLALRTYQQDLVPALEQRADGGHRHHLSAPTTLGGQV
jgi:hypothetical protein